MVFSTLVNCQGHKDMGDRRGQNHLFKKKNKQKTKTKQEKGQVVRDKAKVCYTEGQGMGGERL